MGIISESFMYDIIGLFVTIIIASIAYLKWKFTLWDRIGIPTLTEPPTLLFGNAKTMFLGKSSVGEQFYDYYKEFKSKGLKHGGIFLGCKPFWMLMDPELVKHVIQIDFAHFVNHGGWVDEDNDPLSAHLFSLKDAQWRNMRIKLTPTFTSGKMKMMFQTLADCGVGLTELMNDCAIRKSAVDIRDVLARFTTDIIGSVAFGIECNSLKNPDSLFRKFGRKVFDLSTLEKLKTFMQLLVPHRILKAVKFKITNSEVENFFMKTVQDTVAYREENNIYRKDFMHMLIQLKNRGTVSDDEKIADDGKIQEQGITMNQLAAQSFVFYIAGFETSSTTMTFALYELAINPDVQEKLRDEICSVLKKHDHQLTYNGIMEMIYMDKVLYETLRKYPPLPLLIRECTKDYTIPNSNILIKKGTDVAISSLGLQNDPEYYPDPDVFDPERFSEESKSTRPSFTWLPFGEGPRICIGLRFGIMQSKVGLTAILKNYRISLNKKTKTPLVFSKNSFITAAEGQIWLDIEKIN